MMRLNLQLTMGTFSLSLFGLMGVAFGMNLQSSLEEVRSHFRPLGGISLRSGRSVFLFMAGRLGDRTGPHPSILKVIPDSALELHLATWKLLLASFGDPIGCPGSDLFCWHARQTSYCKNPKAHAF